MLARKNSKVGAIPQKEKGKFKVIFEDSDFLIINKPCGLQVHPDCKNRKDTLVNYLLGEYPELEGVGEDPERPGIVHRLDRDTSGIMLIARNNDSFNYFKDCFKQRKIRKKYLALAHGKIKNETGEIDLAIGRLPKNTAVRSTASYAKDRKSARSRYKVKERFEKRESKSRVSFYTLFEVTPRSGRTHQIRVHLKSLGYPIVGDKIYKFKRQKNPAKLERMFLFSQALEFIDRQGNKRSFEIALDQELQETLNVIRRP